MEANGPVAKRYWSIRLILFSISHILFGMYIRVRVAADTKKESLIKKENDSFLVSVKELAEGNRANVRVLEIIAEHFGVNSKQIRIISGHHSPSKILSIPDKK